MTTLKDSARAFLSLRRIAVAGVSRSPGHAANAIYNKLRGSGHEVYAINPNATQVEGDTCYKDLQSIPGGIEGLVIVTRPAAADALAHECLKNGVRRVWMHRAIGQGSVSAEAVRFCRENGISVIDGACPLMFIEPVDVFHKCFRWVLGWTRQLPRPVD